MNVAKLIAYTTPVDPDYGETVDQFIAYVARVSNPANQNNHETGPKLLRYLIKNAHWSPLEMADVVLEINTTRDIARQILRHRSFSFQEFSQRYAAVTEMAPPRPARLQDAKNRQNSIEEGLDPETVMTWQKIQAEILDNVTLAYGWAIENGIAKEVARSVLPEGLTMSKLYMKGSIRSWVHYLTIRTMPSTQKEHREVALSCAVEVSKVIPGLIELLGLGPEFTGS